VQLRIVQESRNFSSGALFYTRRTAASRPLGVRPIWRQSVTEAPLILVVEDDCPLQGVVEDFLREGGFETHALSSGEEALTVFKGKHGEYQALVTDVNLKGTLSGWDVARRIRETVADFNVVYMTGAAADEWTSHGVPTLLQKPFAAAQLVTAVSNLLNAAPPT
jgi:CheY-like chemotaxis protein